MEKENNDFFKITCFKESKDMTVENKLRVTSFYKKQCLPVITRNKYHLSKQVAPIKCGLEKRFFSATILLKLCESFLFAERKNRVYFGLYKFSLDIHKTQ